MKANIELVGITSVGKPLHGFFKFRSGNHFENGTIYYHYKVPKGLVHEALEKGAKEIKS